MARKECYKLPSAYAAYKVAQHDDQGDSWGEVIALRDDKSQAIWWDFCSKYVYLFRFILQFRGFSGHGSVCPFLRRASDNRLERHFLAFF